MKKITAVIVGVVAGVAALVPVLQGRAQLPPITQSTTRFEYLRAAPYQTVEHSPGWVKYNWRGYRACTATGPSWTCRDFEPPQNGNEDALALTLAALGNEGWELASTVYSSDPVAGGTTYLFKRLRP